MTLLRRWLFVYFAAVAALFAVSALHPQGLAKYRHLAREADRVALDNETLKAEVRRLRGEVKALSGDPAALERAAREELGYVRPDEVVFQFDDARGMP